MTGKLPLPRPLKGYHVERFKYDLITVRWRYVTSMVIGGLALMLILFAGLHLVGVSTPQYPAIADPDQALPEEVWPSYDDTLRSALFEEDGIAETLNQDDLRNRLAEIGTNNRLIAAGRPPRRLASETDAPELSVDASANIEAYRDWASSKGCMLGGWEGEARRQVAALVRNGVWNCSDAQRWIASWPMVETMGTLGGGVVTVALLAALLFVAILLVRRMWRLELLRRLNAALYGSWAG
ncbi:hypothetical protein [Qipengyuania sp. JC766]|uniref:hypothetical protein n=1 Tax=Qipengyuania sp. JC766 TaxID=3232139 RepID=UPI003458D8B0